MSWFFDKCKWINLPNGCWFVGRERKNDRQNAKRRQKTRNWAGPWRQISSGVRNAGFRFDPRCSSSFVDTDAGIEIILQACQNEAPDRGRDKNYVWEAVEIVSRLSGHFTRMFMFVNNASIVSILCVNVSFLSQQHRGKHQTSCGSSWRHILF